MPELPEVDNIRITLSHKLSYGQKLAAIDFARKDLRFPIPIKSLKKLIGSKFLEITRRGKYLIFQFDKGLMISHLGMTGKWIFANKNESPNSHDHIFLTFENDGVLKYNDPRRFGYVDFVTDIGKLSRHPFFLHLGLEPFDSEMDSKYLMAKALNSNRSVKTFLMDQEVVVGVGNIYASEVLFNAHIKPQRIVKKIKMSEWKIIAQSIKIILKKAIERGGSTIRDYRMSDGSEGANQKYFFVYDRASEPCKICQKQICSSVMGGRATYWCPNCQK